MQQPVFLALLRCYLHVRGGGISKGQACLSLRNSFVQLYHMRAGMEVYFNVGTDVQLPIPADIPSFCGQCAVSNRSSLLASPRGYQPAGPASSPL